MLDNYNIILTVMGFIFVSYSTLIGIIWTMQRAEIKELKRQVVEDKKEVQENNRRLYDKIDEIKEEININNTRLYDKMNEVVQMFFSKDMRK
jgi:Na+-transporting methylmalonyl-CoA/oxaloacetate decarboxylase gamma subunit